MSTDEKFDLVIKYCRDSGGSPPPCLALGRFVNYLRCGKTSLRDNQKQHIVTTRNLAGGHTPSDILS